MKKIKTLLSFLFILSYMGTAFAQSKAITNNKPTFTHGVNLCEWFEIWSPGIPPLRRYDKSDFEYLKAMGVDIIRLPIHFDMVMMPDNPTKVSPIVFEYLDMACDWAEELGIFLVIDNHSYNGLSKYPAPAEVENFLMNLWPQIANRYKNCSDYILYEILNEPEFKNAQWLPIQKKMLDVIRAIDNKHTIVVTGAEWGGLNTLLGVKPYEDKNLIYTFHFYDPFIFTHQGANWTSKEIEALQNVPFPYDKDRIPKLQGAAKGSYLEQSIRQSYAQEGTAKYIQNSLQKAVNYSEKNSVPVWCGEMGAYNLTSQPEDRARWFETVGGILLEKKIAFTVWGFHGGFGLFKKDTAGIYPRDLEPEVVKSVGFVIPKGIKQKSDEDFPLPLIIYDDLPGKNINFSAWGTTNGKSETDVAEGINSINVSKIDQYGAISFDIRSYDFTKIENNLSNTYLTFKIKYYGNGQNLQIRFVDSESQTEQPWRNAYNLTNSKKENNKWISVEIPLSDFSLTGAWRSSDSSWHNADANTKFDWNRVQKLEFVAETSAITLPLSIDDIKLEVK